MLLFSVPPVFSQGFSDYEYISPKLNSVFVSEKTNLILRYGEKIDVQSIPQHSGIKITGEKSGLHTYNLILSDDGKTVILNFPVHFQPGEAVDVLFDTGIKTISEKKLPIVNFLFHVSPLKEKISYTKINDDGEISFTRDEPVMKSSLVTSADSLPADFPKIKIRNSDNPSPGYTFITTSDVVSGVGNYLMMIKNDGTPFWYKKIDGHFPSDLKMQPNGMLSYADIKESYYFAGGGETVHKIMDSTYTVVDSFATGNGYVADSHDFQLLSNGHALLISYDLQLVDMSKIVSGGNPGAYVAGSIIQELDSDKNVVFQWRTWDYIQIDESYFDLTLAAFDPMHANALDVDTDGNILVSFRNISQIIKINRATGEIMWRLGGRKNQFTFLNEHQENAPLYFSRPHDIRSLPNRHITLFDNGLDHKPAYSRAVEYEIDGQNKTATLVWEYKHPDKVFAPMQGSVQRLPNGNTMIGWGNATKSNSNWPAATEITSDGTIVFEMLFENKGMLSYRALKYPWLMNTDAAQVTVYELWQGNDYVFNNSSDSTFTSLKLNSFTGSLYNYVTVKYSQLAPVNPQFTGQAPIILKKRITATSDLLNIDGVISFDADKLVGQYDPNKIIVYQRETEGNGLFLPLNTSYNSATKKLTSVISNFGEFIFGIGPDNVAAKEPLQLLPADSASVNQTLPVKLSWTPNGYVNTYQLQVADNPQFANALVDVDSLKDASFVMNQVNADTIYYWHVKSINNSGASNWSKTFLFKTTLPYVKVVSPNGGEKIQRGLSYFVKWDDNIEDSVIVELERNGELVGIIDTTISSGIYKWTLDVNLPVGSDYRIKIRSLIAGTLFDESNSNFEVVDTTVNSVGNELNTFKYFLAQNYPNPFNPSTKINYSLQNGEMVTLRIFDVLGREVATLVNQYQSAGNHTVSFNASSLASGMYFYKLEAGSFQSIKKMMLLK